MTTDSTANPITEQSKDNKQGEFFIIDIETWKTIYGDLLHLLNTRHLNDVKATRILATYLVLACGTGGDNVTSRWSATACYKYAGFSVQTAKLAIEYLENLGHISIKEKTTEVISKNPTYKLTKPMKGNEIFIPKSLIMGATKEITPIGRLYMEGNPHLLYLFIRLYAFQYKTLDIIDPSLVSSLLHTNEDHSARTHPVIVYNESKKLNVWATNDAIVLTAKHTSNFFNFKQLPNAFKYNDNLGVWAFYFKIISLGLLHPVSYACIGDSYSDPEEIDTICELDTITQKHFQFLLECISEQYANDNKKILWHSVVANSNLIAVLPSSYQKVHFAVFYRLRYRTKLGDKLRFEQERKVNLLINNTFKSLYLNEFTKEQVAGGEKFMIKEKLI